MAGEPKTFAERLRIAHKRGYSGKAAQDAARQMERERKGPPKIEAKKSTGGAFTKRARQAAKIH
jgi:hypothetical protein